MNPKYLLMAKRAAQRHEHIQATRPDTPESLREAMEGFAELEKDFARVRARANAYLH